MNGQLALFDLEPNGNGGHRMTTAEAGLRREAPPGASRLLRELVRRGLPPGDLRFAAELCLLLDERDER